jgi:PAS domain S-box-containing protein
MRNTERIVTLRQKAETLFKEAGYADLREEFSNIEELLEELNIHQIELEMQSLEVQRANETLTAEREKYRTLYMQAPVAYFTLNKTGNIIELNQAAADMLRIPIQSFRYTSIFPYLEEGSRRKFTQYFKQVFASESVEYGDLAFINSANEQVLAHLWASTYFDNELQERLVRCAAVDQTRMRTYEKELAYQKALNGAIERYETVFAAANAGIAMISPTGHILECNKAFAGMLGYETEELTRLSLFDVLKSGILSGKAGFHSLVSRSSPSTRLEARFTKRNGQILWADAMISAVFMEDEPEYLVVVMTDITSGVASRQTILQLNNRLEAAMGAGNMAWWEMELPSGKIAFNESKATMLGYKPEQFIHYQDFMALVHPEDSEATMEAFRRHIECKTQAYECEYRIRNATGEYRWFHDVGRITSREAAMATYTGMVMDITRLKQTEESVKRFRVAIDNSADQVFLIDKDNLRFIDVNASACSALEYTRDELLSMGPQDIKPDHSREDLLVLFDEVLQDPMKTGVLEAVHRSKSGRDIPVEVRLKAFESVGQTLLIAIARDVTERKQIEEKLKLLNQQFLTILQNVQVGIMVIARPSRKILYANPYMQSLYQDALEEKLCSNVCGCEGKVCPECPASAPFQSEEVEDIPFVASEMFLPDIGKWFVRQVSSIEWMEQQPAALLILTDISSLKEVEQLKEDIGRITRHDLKNPLNGILGAAQLLLMDDDSKLSEEQIEYIQMIETSGRRILQLVDESMGLYKMEKGLYQLTQEAVDLEKLMTSIVHELQPLLSERQIQIEIARETAGARSTGTMKARGEQLLCYSIFSNLLNNALDATGPKGRLKVTFAKMSAEDVSVSIWNGSAIAEEIRSSFGNKYSTWGKKKGSGLGVYSARLMTETQGGTLTWESSVEDGTLVTVSLPACPDDQCSGQGDF